MGGCLSPDPVVANSGAKTVPKGEIPVAVRAEQFLSRDTGPPPSGRQRFPATLVRDACPGADATRKGAFCQGGGSVQCPDAGTHVDLRVSRDTRHRRRSGKNLEGEPGPEQRARFSFFCPRAARAACNTLQCWHGTKKDALRRSLTGWLRNRPEKRNRIELRHRWRPPPGSASGYWTYSPPGSPFWTRRAESSMRTGVGIALRSIPYADIFSSGRAQTT